MLLDDLISLIFYEFWEVIFLGGGHFFPKDFGNPQIPIYIFYILSNMLIPLFL